MSELFKPLKSQRLKSEYLNINESGKKQEKKTPIVSYQRVTQTNPLTGAFKSFIKQVRPVEKPVKSKSPIEFEQYKNAQQEIIREKSLIQTQGSLAQALKSARLQMAPQDRYTKKIEKQVVKQHNFLERKPLTGQSIIAQHGKQSLKGEQEIKVSPYRQQVAQKRNSSAVFSKEEKPQETKTGKKLNQPTSSFNGQGLSFAQSEIQLISGKKFIKDLSRNPSPIFNPNEAVQQVPQKAGKKLFNQSSSFSMAQGTQGSQILSRYVETKSPNRVIKPDYIDKEGRASTSQKKQYMKNKTTGESSIIVPKQIEKSPMDKFKESLTKKSQFANRRLSSNVFDQRPISPPQNSSQRFKQTSIHREKEQINHCLTYREAPNLKVVGIIEPQRATNQRLEQAARIQNDFNKKRVDQKQNGIFKSQIF